MSFGEVDVEDLQVEGIVPGDDPNDPDVLARLLSHADAPRSFTAARSNDLRSPTLVRFSETATEHHLGNANMVTTPPASGSTVDTGTVSSTQGAPTSPSSGNDTGDSGSNVSAYFAVIR